MTPQEKKMKDTEINYNMDNSQYLSTGKLGHFPLFPGKNAKLPATKK
jgi:hypothetical protein